MRQTILLHFLIFVFALLPIKSDARLMEIKEVSILSIHSAITPATFDYLKNHLEKIPSDAILVIKMNTPGGLISTTKDIITLLSSKKKPFAVWITPEGAAAASAGAIIASAAHYIFMSPGTNMGAATPVGLGEDIKENDSRKKVLNDLSALVRSLCAHRKRPATPFEKMITEAKSYTAREAADLGIIDGIVTREKDMFKIFTTKTISIDDIPLTLELKDVELKNYVPTLGQRILEVIANPSMAYILFLLGIALIYFEFQAPGGFVAGSIGVCLLLLAAIAFQVLPLDWGSLGLILVGIFLLVLEIFIVSYGLLSIGGIAAIVAGSLFLFHDESGYLSVEYSVVFSTLLGAVVAIGGVLWYLWKEKKQKIGDFFLPIGASGIVLTKSSPREYQVRVQGEIWHAFSDEDIELNQAVVVTSADSKKLILQIRKK